MAVAVANLLDEYRLRAVAGAQAAAAALAELGVRVIVTGSLARGKFNIHSDVDLLITYCPRRLKYRIESIVEDIPGGCRLTSSTWTSWLLGKPPDSWRAPSMHPTLVDIENSLLIRVHLCWKILPPDTSQPARSAKISHAIALGQHRHSLTYFLYYSTIQ